MNKTVACPTCQKNVVWDNNSPWRPFCSERCKLIDLGDWADESNRIAGESIMPENLQPPLDTEY
ncbi:MAG: DNA gyrase inhibitor YacG [Gammaproteobacteria bacterium]|nr:DNA gyrase inhibitor YacG [Gammaproteobacteria bacterium]